MFIAPWLRGAAALLHDARFDPHERLELLARERVDVLCMAPTEYRVIAKRATLRPLPVAARRWSPPARRSTPRSCAPGTRRPGSEIRDGYGQTETGQLTGAPLGDDAAARARWAAPLPGVELGVDDGELRRRPARPCPTFFLGYLGEAAREPAALDVATAAWRHLATGDRVHATRTATCTSRAAPTT